MTAGILFIALVLLLALTEYAIASSMMGMSIPEFVAWGFRL